MIDRIIQKTIEFQLFKGKTILLTGARQTGKTHLVKNIIHKNNGVYYNCEIQEVKDLLNSTSITALSKLIPKGKLLVFDEAQDIEDIGKKLKILHDEFPDIQIIATGSSSFELLNRASEPLTGRSRQFMLYPLSLQEIINDVGIVYAMGKISDLLVFGSYPEVYNAVSNDEKIAALINISNNYLYKDTLKYEDIKKPLVFKKLLTILALQVGNEVSLNKLSNEVNVSIQTVEKYLDILEKNYIIFSLMSFSRNLQKEIAKSRKYYFCDLGLRNSIINNFNQIALRQDVGQIWENFCVIERVKHNHYAKLNKNLYFWRTYDQQEIDLIEEYDGKLSTFEFKFSTEKAKFPKIFAETYEGSSFTLINLKNVFDLLG
ncbi:MAG TPA: ATP-binding protein [Saprospiraceae bacterium]|nr:ATP-binding protein [Saprospiraceae bacterium]